MKKHPLPVKHLNILVTSVSRKVFLVKEIRNAVSRLAKKHTIWGGDADASCIGRYFVDAFWQMPVDADLTIDHLLEFCAAKGISIIIPTRDRELPFYSRHRKALAEEGIQVMSPPLAAVNACRDKLLFYQRLRNTASITPISTATDPDDLETKTFVVKEQFGAGSRDLGLNLSKSAARKLAAKLEAPIFQPYIPGTEFTIDLYLNHNGIPKGAVARSRDTVVHGESQVSTTVSDEFLEQACMHDAALLGLTGPCLFQVIVDRNNQHHLVECNCRIGGGTSLSIAAGLESIYWFLLECLGHDLAEYPFKRYEKELRLVRYPEDRIVPIGDEEKGNRQKSKGKRILKKCLK